MFKPALILAVALAGPSAAQFPSAPVWAPTAADVETPPAEFRQMPHAPFTVVIGSPLEVHVFCSSMGAPPPDQVILACTLPQERVIVFPQIEPGQEAYAGALWVHELAHLPGADGRGWSHAR